MVKVTAETANSSLVTYHLQGNSKCTTTCQDMFFRSHPQAKRPHRWLTHFCRISRHLLRHRLLTGRRLGSIHEGPEDDRMHQNSFITSLTRAKQHSRIFTLLAPAKGFKGAAASATLATTAPVINRVPCAMKPTGNKLTTRQTVPPTPARITIMAILQ